MSSGFVSGGSLEKPIERDDAWKRAQDELEADRKRKADLEKEHGGKTLFEVLQSNKAAKQDAFEEAAKLKNQFRSLDNDEIDFLDSVLESEREKEKAFQTELNSQLADFRKQRERIEHASSGVENSTAVDNEISEWNATAKKRKAAAEKSFVKGVKLRKTSSSSPKPPSSDHDTLKASFKTQDIKKQTPKPSIKNDSKPKKPSVTPVLGLVAYSSEDDD